MSEERSPNARSPTVEECVQAGMYFFGRNDFDRARTWWKRALTLEPDNVRARECIAALDRTLGQGAQISKPPSPVGVAPSPGAAGTVGTAPGAMADSEADTDKRSPVRSAPDDASHEEPDDRPPQSAVDPDEWAPPSADSFPGFGAEDGMLGAYAGPDAADLIGSSGDLPVSSEEGEHVQSTPWDVGPANTSIVNLESEDDDALPSEKTPMPGLEPDPLFRGADSYTPMELVGLPEDARRLELIRRAKAKIALDDLDRAIELLKKVDPPDEESNELLLQAQDKLQDVYASRIGRLDLSPAIKVSDQDLIWLGLNHRAGYILSQIDGTVTYEDLVALSGMPRLDTLRILYSLTREGVIGVADDASDG